jgi:hypothetical protein
MKNYKEYLEEAGPNKSIGKWGKWPAYVSGFKSLSKGSVSRTLTLKDGSSLDVFPETARVLYSYLDGLWLDDKAKEAFARNLSKNKELFNKMLKMAQKRVYG